MEYSSISNSHTPMRVLALVSVLSLILFSATNDPVQAGPASRSTWKSRPFSNSWRNEQNWRPEVVPDGPDAVAAFGYSHTTIINLDDWSHARSVGTILFEAGASAYILKNDADTFDRTYVTLSGSGVINNSGIVQNFIINSVDSLGSYPSTLFFTNSAAAGDLTQFTVNGTDDDEEFGGYLVFQDTATAGSSVIHNLGGGFDRGITDFRDSASAENATIVNESGARWGGLVIFSDSSSAGNTTIINEGAALSGYEGGATSFSSTADASNATIIAKGGSGGGNGAGLYIWTDCTARIEIFGNGSMTIASVTVGSIEGDGLIFLGASNLTIGSNDLSTVFSGSIQDTGSITKIGSTVLTLSGSSTYSGGTTIEEGQVVVSNSTGSATGTGTVQVNAGFLSGFGTIAGAVTVGTGIGSGAFLDPGPLNFKTGTLTIQGRLSLKADSIYTYTVNTRSAVADSVVANGVRIDPGTSFWPVRIGNRELMAGTVFTVINNTSDTAISGTFDLLPDGGVLTLGNNDLQANYEGGDGNDLTLTVLQESAPVSAAADALQRSCDGGDCGKASGLPVEREYNEMLVVGPAFILPILPTLFFSPKI